MTITFDDFEVFCRRSFSRVLDVASELGDDLVNTRPAMTGGSSGCALVTHILGVCDWWIGHVLLGRPSARVRDAEFTATGTVADLEAAVDGFLRSLARDRSAILAATGLAGAARTQRPLEADWTVGAVLLHVYEELAQHLGHLEITADIVKAETGRAA